MPSPARPYNIPTNSSSSRYGVSEPPGLLFLFERLTLHSPIRQAHPRAKPRRERRRFGLSGGRAEDIQSLLRWLVLTLHRKTRGAKIGYRRRDHK